MALGSEGSGKENFVVGGVDLYMVAFLFSGPNLDPISKDEFLRCNFVLGQLWPVRQICFNFKN